jgi:pyruvate dehydrogenase E1 component
MTTDAFIRSAPTADPELDVLDRLQRRVLWLAVSQVHHANKVRANHSGVKVGGHQASSASMVSIMSALWFRQLQAADRVSVKPHASPVLHAINYLLGRLDRSYLTELRTFGGLQSYPSRTKDPDPVDFSTGSVGIGATATIWSALAHRYVASHHDVPAGGRHIALVGDAELDEGAIWEAVLDPMVGKLGEVLWVVDVNRQSLDRVVPDIEVLRRSRMFEAAGWQTLTIKYGRRLRTLFAAEGGDALQARIDGMGNEEYQRLLRTPAADLRDRLPGDRKTSQPIRRILADLTDGEIAAALADLGGHDLGDLMAAYDQAYATTDRPTVIFAYTIKGWGLPSQGHPANHSSLLTEDQWRQLAIDSDADPDDPWALFAPETAEAELCREVTSRLARPAFAAGSGATVPTDLGQSHSGTASTQQAFGRFFLNIVRSDSDVARRIVTVSPDVASSTNLGGWINKVGVWNTDDRFDWFDDDQERLVRWKETGHGQHIELGIAEGNLVGLLGELGATWSRDGQSLLPIGTIYDPFVTRALEPWSFGMYAGGQSILVGTPSGVTLSPEGGAHQSIITPSVGLEQPGCIAWEPAFGQDLEWTLLHALSLLGREGGTSAYFRLTTRPLDQAIADVPVDPILRERRRSDVIAGGYRLRKAPGNPAVTLIGVGAVLPEVVAASDHLTQHGVHNDVICLTSADLVFRATRARQGLQPGDDRILDRLLPADRAAPIVTVLDGHPHTLSFLSGVNGSPIASLGVSGFGQSGDVDDLYRYFGIDAKTIIGAAWDLIDAS